MAATAVWTRAHLDDLPDDGRRYEIVDGRLLVSPLARLRHQAVVRELTIAIGTWCRANHGAMYPGANVDLDETNHLEPDVVWSSDTDDSGVGFGVTPELVVEVSSPSTRRFDEGVKLDRYAASGAREVWLVDLDGDELRRYVVVDRRPGEPQVLRPGEVLVTDLLPGLELPVGDVLARRG